MSGIYLVLLLSVSVFVVCNAADAGVELVQLVKEVDKRELSAEDVCTKACEDAGKPFVSVGEDGTCLCQCQYWECDVTIPGVTGGDGKRAQSPVSTKAKPKPGLKEAINPCCSNNACAQLCTGANMEGGACDNDGNCQCNCKPCFGATWEGTSCEGGGKRSRSLLWS